MTRSTNAETHHNMIESFQCFGGVANSLGQVQRRKINTFRGFVDALLAEPARIPLTREAFHSLPKVEQNRAKSVEFVTPAVFASSPSKRVSENATVFYLVALDIDDSVHAAPLVNDHNLIATLLGGLPFFAYRTATSTSIAPRLRIFVHAAGLDVSLYPKAVAFVAARLKLPTITKESSIAVQPMYLPSIFLDEVPCWHHPFIAQKEDGLPLSLEGIGADFPSQVRLPTSAAKTGEDLSGAGLDNLLAADITIEIARSALDQIDPDSVYNDWIEFAAALRHQFPDEPEASQAYELFDEWSAKGDKYVDADETAAKWASLRPVPTGRQPITFRTILKAAQKTGWTVQKSRFDLQTAWLNSDKRTKTEIENEGIKRIAELTMSRAQREILVAKYCTRLAAFGVRVPVKSVHLQITEAINARCKQSPDPLPVWARDLIYVAGENVFLDSKTGMCFVSDAVDNQFRKHMPNADQLPHDYILTRCNLPQVGKKMYYPGAGRIFTSESGVVCANTYRRTYPESDPLHVDEASSILAKHFSKLIAEPEHRQTMMDYFAFLVQRPGEKVLWAPVIQGVQGCGKSTLAVLMEHVLGPSNVRRLEAGSTLGSPFNGYAASFQLVVFDETRIVGTNPRELMEKLKPLIVETHVNINRKYIEQEDVKNVGNYLFFTNHHDAIPLDENERRFFILKSPLQTAQDLVNAEVLQCCQELHRLLDIYPGAFRAVFEDWQISTSFCPKGHAPVTSYKSQMVRSSESALKSAARECIEDSESHTLQKDLLSFDELLQQLRAQPSHARLSAQVLVTVLTELGYKTLGKYRFGETRFTIWAALDGEFALQSRDDIAKEFNGRRALNIHADLFGTVEA